MWIIFHGRDKKNSSMDHSWKSTGRICRDTSRQVARRLNIKGSAVNLSDGTVQVIAEGAASAVKQFQSWLVIGPDMAKVTKVETVDLEYHTEFKDFKIG